MGYGQTAVFGCAANFCQARSAFSAARLRSTGQAEARRENNCVSSRACPQLGDSQTGSCVIHRRLACKEGLTEWPDAMVSSSAVVYGFILFYRR